MTLEPGLRIREFEIASLIGKGGMGEVYLARDLNLELEVAIKCLDPYLTRDEKFVQRFRKEASIQSTLTHQNIVGFKSYFQEQGVWFMVLEYAPGITLRELLNRTGPIPEERSLRIFRQLAAGLAYAHGRGIVHRDIKPANIMVDPTRNDAVKIMDFGIARMMGDLHLTVTGETVGTICYMSPEQVNGDRDIDHRSDIYSAGIVLFEMLSGKLPFEVDTDSSFKIQSKIVNEPAPDPRVIYPYISEETVRVLLRMVEKHKANRPQDMGTLFQAPPTMTRTETPGNQPARPEPKHPGPAQAAPVQSSQPDNARPVTGAKKNSLWLVILAMVVVSAVVFIALSYTGVIGRKNDIAEEGDILEEIPVGKDRASDRPKPKLDLVYVQGGWFIMGCGDEFGEEDEYPPRNVQVSPFYIGRYEVTQQIYQEIMQSNPSVHKGENLPVSNVTWYDAVAFCNKLSEMMGLEPCYREVGGEWVCDYSKQGYRLPSEAEWEFAARGGVRSKGFLYAGSNNEREVAWFDENSGRTVREVGQKEPNELGIHDMSGNLWEWCNDWYSEFYYSGPDNVNPRGAPTGIQKVFRGGSAYDKLSWCRVANRGFNYPHDRKSYINKSLRIARSA